MGMPPPHLMATAEVPKTHKIYNLMSKKSTEKFKSLLQYSYVNIIFKVFNVLENCGQTKSNCPSFHRREGRRRNFSASMRGTTEREPK
jgi:hypothetical protein